MMKGKLEISLVNEETGEKEVHKEENMITNAIPCLLGLMMNMSKNDNFAKNIFPLATKGLGGLFLFDGQLDEDPNNFHFPDSVHLVGCAGRNSSVSSKMIGSLNGTETLKLENGYTHVWDFSTSQANGTISSLALTSSTAGNNPWSEMITYNNSISIDFSQVPIHYDSATGHLFLTKYGKIAKRKLYTEKITLNAPYYNTDEIVYDFNKSGRLMNISGYDNCIYMLNRTVASNTVTFNIRKLVFQDGEYKEEPEKIITVNNATIQGSNESETSYYYRYTYVISKEKLYFISADSKKLFKVDLNNTTDVSEFTFDTYLLNYIYPMYNGSLFCIFSSKGQDSNGGIITVYSAGIIYSDGKYTINDVAKVNDSYWNRLSSFIGVEGDNLALFRSEGDSLYCGYMNNYLGSICNLSTPIHKTSAQSMKITYTIVDE